MDTQVVVQIFSWLTVGANVLLVGLIGAMVVAGNKSGMVVTQLVTGFRRWGLELSLVVALTATGGSLIFSEVLGLPPCKLCWFQRIFMYPLVPILALAVGKKDKQVAEYVLVVAAFGAVIAGYHYALQLNPGLPTTCGTVGLSVSCTENFFLALGYITIPLMSLSAFLLVAALMVAMLVEFKQESLLVRLRQKLASG